MRNSKQALAQHVDFGNFKDLVYDYLDKKLLYIKGETSDIRERRVLAYIEYIESVLCECHAESGLCLVFEINLYYEGFKSTYTGKAEFSFGGLADCLTQTILQITRRLDKPIYEPLNDKLATALTQACLMETNIPNAVMAIKHFSEVVKLIQEEK